MKLQTLFRPLCLRADVRECIHRFISSQLTKEMVVLDVGCGENPFANVLRDKVAQFIGMDRPDGFYPASNCDLLGSADNIPLADESVDAVICSQVLEHLRDPALTIHEIARVLKKGGHCYISVPLLYPLHAAPHDYFRFSEYLMRDMLHRQQLQVYESFSIGGFWYCAGIFSELYLKNFNRGFLRRCGLIGLTIWVVKMVCHALHQCESQWLKWLRRQHSLSRTMWTVTYVFAAKKHDAPV